MTARAPRLWLASLLLMAAFAFLPGLASLPITDRDEARFAQASRQMVESGDPIDIRLGDEPRLKKPVGIYWLQSAAAVLSGKGAEAPLWVHRLPSLLGACLSVLLLAATGAPLFGWRAALGGAALLAAGLVIGAEARIAKTDAALLAAVLAGQAVLARLHMANTLPRRGLAYPFWLAIAAAVLLKGPIGPLVIALTAATLAFLRREIRWLAPLASPSAILMALAIAAPWFIAITLRGGAAFWQGSVGVDLMPKLASGQEGKGAPPGSYLLALWLTFWPATALLILALPGFWQARRTRPMQFLAAWALPFWLVLEAVPTKLLHYPLPVYPALALAAAAFAPAGLSRAGRPLRIAATVALLPGLALGGALLVIAIRSGSPAAAVPIGLGLLAATTLAGATAHAILTRAAARLVPLAALTGVALFGGLFPGIARLDLLWPGHRAAAMATEHAKAAGCPAPRLAGWGFTEPSLLWLGGRDTPLISGNAPLPQDLSAPCTYVIRAISDGQPPAPPTCQSLSRFEGLAIGAGRRVRLDLLDCGGPR